MSIRETVAQTSGAASVLAGPVLATAEATGLFSDQGRPLMVYVLSGALTLVGGMFTVLMWFIKREHASITGGLAKLGESLHKLNNQITAVTLQLTELRADGARRISIEDHSRSSAYLHEKVNKLARRVDHMLGKMGLPPSGGEGEG